MGVAIGVYVFLSGFLMFAVPFILGGIGRLTGIDLSPLSLFIIAFASALAAADAYKTFTDETVYDIRVAFKLSFVLLVFHLGFWAVATMVSRRSLSLFGNDHGPQLLLVSTVLLAMSFASIFLGAFIGLSRKPKSKS